MSDLKPLVCWFPINRNNRLATDAKRDVPQALLFVHFYFV